MYLNFFVSEGQEESLAVFRPQPVNAPSVNGTPEIVVYLFLGVFHLMWHGLNAKPATKQSGNKKYRGTMTPATRRTKHAGKQISMCQN